MAGASGRYGIKSKNSNPFLDEDELEDVDDDLFLKKAPNKSTSMSICLTHPPERKEAVSQQWTTIQVMTP